MDKGYGQNLAGNRGGVFEGADQRTEGVNADELRQKALENIQSGVVTEEGGQAQEVALTPEEINQELAVGITPEIAVPEKHDIDSVATNNLEVKVEQGSTRSAVEKLTEIISSNVGPFEKTEKIRALRNAVKNNETGVGR
jgi:hypothetical protein